MNGSLPRSDEVPDASEPAGSEPAGSEPAPSEPDRAAPAELEAERAAREDRHAELEAERTVRRGLESAMRHNPDLVARFSGAARQVERLVVSARHLMQLIEEVLTFSRLEAAREDIRPEPVEVAELMDEVTAILGPLAEDKGLSVRVERPPPGTRVDTDPRKVRQILLNLASNAAQSSAGTVK